jgi:hypothetical protein
VIDATLLLRHSMSAWQRQPETRIEDAYKWLFHATCGGEHAIEDEGMARQWLDREWLNLTTVGIREPALERLDPKGRIVRIHLRPYKHSGRDREMLLALFVRSAERFRPEKVELRRVWAALGVELMKRPLSKHLTLSEFRRLTMPLERANFPAIHHSDAYVGAYRPAYRVVLGELWQ